MKKSKIIGFAAALVVLIAMLFIPEGAGLSTAGIRTLGVTIALLLLLITEVFPPGVSCLFIVGLMPLVGVQPNFAAAISGFDHPIMLFTLASFGIAAAFTAVPLSKRILVNLLKKFGKNVKLSILAIMICAALVSSMISNIPTTAIFMAIGLSFLELYNDMPEAKKKTGRAIMIAVPLGGMIGGMMTPAGSSINLLALGYLESLTNGEFTVTFVQWMAVGIPLSIVMIPLAWFLVCKVYKPVELPHEQIQDFVNNIDIPKKMEKKEKWVLFVILVMLILMILSSWVKTLEVYTIALLGCAIFIAPKIGVLSWDKFCSEVTWVVIIITGTVLSIGDAINANGVSTWLVETFYPQGLQLGEYGIIALCAICTFVMLAIIPVAPAVVAVLAGPMVTIAMNTGYSPAFLVLTIGLCAANCYLFPLDNVPLLTYGTGYYKMTDMCKSTLFLQIAMVILSAIWIPIAAGLVGLI